MKTSSLFFATLALVVLAGVGCAADPVVPVVPASPASVVMTSDFAPPTGRGDGLVPGPAGERRLLIARSDDGVVFAPTGTILTDQGNVPDAVVTDDGTVYLYYIGQGIGTQPETTAVAISEDNGATWAYKFLILEDWPSNRSPSDPDVVLREDGTFRMYFTDSLAKDKLGIRYADSADGITFAYDGGVALKAAKSVLDSTTFFFDGVWHMYVLDPKLPVQYYATSANGDTFVTDGTPVSFTAANTNYFGSNPLIEDGVVRLFGFGLGKNGIRSFRSTDGKTWTAEDGERLAVSPASTLDGTYLQDLTVAKLADGTYLLVYVSDIPRE